MGGNDASECLPVEGAIQGGFHIFGDTSDRVS